MDENTELRQLFADKAQLCHNLTATIVEFEAAYGDKICISDMKMKRTIDGRPMVFVDLQVK